MKQQRKSIIPTAVIVGGVLTVLGVIFSSVVICVTVVTLSDDVNKYTVETEYGDQFTVTTDFMHKTFLQEGNSRLFVRLDYEVTAEDFTTLCHDSGLTAYMVEAFVIYDKGDGFEKFDDDLAADAELTWLVKQNLLSGEMFFRRNAKIFLDDRSFHDETEVMLEMLTSGAPEFDDELARYGFDPCSDFNDSIRRTARLWLNNERKDRNDRKAA